MSTKIQEGHLARAALVYVRQSTQTQVQRNRESTSLQYDLAAHAQTLGWRADQVTVIDEDQGQSGSTTRDRTGFARLMSEVALGSVGIVLAVEASRLARNNADWQRLIWFCSLTDTLLGEHGAVYDPSAMDDRMVLGLKGTISEIEWHTIRRRMHDAALHKARRGELQIALPPGLEWQEDGTICLSPDRQVVDTLRVVFAKFAELGAARQVALYLREHGVKIPRRARVGKSAAIKFSEATSPAVGSILTHPAYAGAYVYGRHRSVRKIEPDGNVRTKTITGGPETWAVCVHHHHEGLISWDQYQKNQLQLRANCPPSSGASDVGPAREGTALLQGLVFCGQCGRRMGVAYRDGCQRVVSYTCHRTWYAQGGKICQTVGGRQVEQAVIQLFLETVQPAGVEVALQAVTALREERETVSHHWSQRVERAAYEAEQARKRYEAVDPDNRLVAAELEQRWNAALASAEAVRAEAVLQVQRLGSDLTEAQRSRVTRAASDVTRVWELPTTLPRDRKRLLRAVIRRVVLRTEGAVLRVAVEWKGGEVTNSEMRRRQRGEPTRMTDEHVVDTVRRLAADGYVDKRIAQVLSASGHRTATGLTFTGVRVQTIRLAHQIPNAKPPAPADGRVYSAEEAARQLHVSTTTILQWLRSGLLAGKQLVANGPWKIPLDDDIRRRLAGKDAPEGWLRLDEAARQLGVTRQTVITWVKQGKLQAVRTATGRRSGWRICVDSTTSRSQGSLF